ncbi:TlyA family RNA methyltransferase [Texcoconibacillus texcoconensis]|uniref:23S rRNA (Cytidine1920-2'-O)/16S rRNA (Cytidine1409-2'-O)-methyltransferase n=1 Tax=Texcoconibacillus texcoconensis TaxID=1095777 RepID=A0A840QNZ7_9BACI|nr:TlyA family RNA methyltransferase [Texcoconibacillus texcoconensis]MBB5173063.1 23S rRNA (cytidine1920-2'-O)/16S rRNA (cytidine1409-2'-O)-methyltransferase [Texcoconibacillus texcoconensis]
MKKRRIDIALVEEGLMETREKAKRSIMAGLVFVDGERVDKPGTKVPVDGEIVVKGKAIPYVSRGGLKLAKALDVFDIDVVGKTMLDIGASTGGFTDCALQNGAEKVYALDVGTNQLAWSLRSDDRVEVMEQTNFRYATVDHFQFGRPNFATIDVSFISLTQILPVLAKILAPGSDVSTLVKPQFEAGREEVGKNGIVRDPKIHQKVLRKTMDEAIHVGFSVKGLATSPIQGSEGNIEFLLHLHLEEQQEPQLLVSDDDLTDVLSEVKNLIKR